MENSNLERKCLDIVNSLITKYSRMPGNVQSVDSINSDLIVFLFESITKHNIPDLLANESKESEAHNIQAVIDTLSLDLLGISLSHITGEDVVAGNVVSMCDLLEVLQGVDTYFVSKRPVQHHPQRCLFKRKIRKKNGSSITSYRSETPSVESVSSDLILHLALTKPNQLDKYCMKRKSTLRNLGQLSSSIESSQSPSSSGSYTVVDSDKHIQRKVGGLSSSSSYESSLTTIKKPDSHHSSTASRSKQKSGSSSNMQLMKVKTNSIPEYSNSREKVFPVQQKGKETDAEFRQQFQNQDDANKFVNLTKPAGIGRPQAQNERKNVYSSDEIPAIPQRNLKRKLVRLSKKENTKPSLSVPQIQVEDLLEKNFEDKVRGLLDKNSCKTRASQIKNMHLQSMRRPPKRVLISSCKKSFLLPHDLRRRSISHSAVRRKARLKSPMKQDLSHKRDKVLSENHKEGFLQEFFEEFPEHTLSPSVINHITNKYQQHLLRMHKQVKAVLLKKTKTQKQTEEASKKQSLLNNIINKDLIHQRHLNEVKEQKKFDNLIKFKLRDARLESAKMKQYCDEFRTEMRKKMQKRNYAEEQVIENVFKESLKIQKEQVDHLCEEVRETSDSDARQHLIYLEAMENLYQTQFSMLAESLATAKKDEQIRAKTEQQEMNAMQREFQDQLKQEIRFMQKVIVDCTEDIHFREMDAERFKMKLRKRQ